MKPTLIYNATIVNENKTFVGSVLIDNEFISKVFEENEVTPEILNNYEVIDAKGLYLIPGVIDDQVHFRDPGLTHKGDIYSESRAAIAGGVTSFMDMPNTNPQTISIEKLEEKWEIASEKSIANYSFYLGATNDNIKELHKVDKKKVCGIKVFMGASTGNMLVDNVKSLEQIFAETEILIATHCEKEEIICENIARLKQELGENILVKYHPIIRNSEACYQSSAQAIELADKYGSKLHVLHLSTAQEMKLFDSKPLKDKKITGEVCVHHLWFSDRDYEKYGSLIKWNPAIKSVIDREALREALRNNKLDVVATDHAPHLLSEKEGNALKAASGGPLVQHSLQMMLELSKQGNFTIPFVVNKMCHAPADLFQISKRGYIREGYYADLVLLEEKQYTVSQDNILYKCGWSPLLNQTFSYSIRNTFVNGKLVFDGKNINSETRGKLLEFER